MRVRPVAIGEQTPTAYVGASLNGIEIGHSPRL